MNNQVYHRNISGVENWESFGNSSTGSNFNSNLLYDPSLIFAAKGNRWGSFLVAGLLHKPQVLILDESGINLDIESQIIIGDFSKQQKKTGAIGLFHGLSDGLRTVGDQIWNENISGIKSEAQEWGGIVLNGGSVDSIYTAEEVDFLDDSSLVLTASGDQIWHQDRPGVRGIANEGDLFGSSLVAGDFNGDYVDDLAIGVYAEDLNSNSITDAGMVNVLHGSSNGLTASGDQIWHQDTPGVLGGAAQGDQFGNSLAVGDYNGDGVDDLAIGVYAEDLEPIDDAGAVNVLYGSSNNGLTASGDQIWHEDIAGVMGKAEQDDLFGSSLAAGDFDGDGVDDLAIGVPGQDIAIATSSGGFPGIDIANGAGAVNILYGSLDNGLTTSKNYQWHQDIAGVEFGAESGDFFGSTLAVGDFNGDYVDDLAIGVPGESVGSVAGAGAVNVLYGSLDYGILAVDDQIWHQNVNGVEGGAEVGDAFGSSLAVGDFDGDGLDDLAIGVDGEDIGSIINAGAVNVLYGTATGLSAAGDQLWHQDIAGIEFGAEFYDGFGTSLATGDFNNDGADDLAIGVWGESVGDIESAGAVNVIYGEAGIGLTASGDQIWHQNITGVEGEAEYGDLFGGSLTTGDFNKDGFSDLAIGVPGEDVGSIINSGATNIIYGSANGLIA